MEKKTFLILNFLLVLLCVPFTMSNAQYGADLDAYELFVGDYFPSGDHPFSVYFINYGPGSVQEVTLTWSVNGTNTQTETVTSIGAGSSDIFIHDVRPTGKFTIPETGTTHTLQVCLSFPDSEIDPYAGNNCVSKTITRMETAVETVVMIEPHVGVSTSFGPDIELVLQDLLSEYPDNLVVAALHTDDAMELDETPEIVVSSQTGYDMYYAFGLINRFQYPSAYIGESTKPPRDYEDYWENYVDPLLEQIYSPVHLASSASYNSSTRQISVDVDATFLTNLTGEFRFNCYVIEDNVTGVGAGYNQINRYSYESSASDGIANTEPDGTVTGPHPYYNYPSVIEGFEHRNVLRAYLGGPWGVPGSIPASSVSSGQTFNHQFNYTIPTDHDASNTHVIVMVQRYDADQYNRPVYNTLRVDLGASNSSTYVNSTPGPPTAMNFTGKLYLEGAYIGNGQMETTIRDKNLLPNYQPYNNYPYYFNEQVYSNLPANAVDWILVEARSGTPSATNRATTTVETQAGFVLSDGTIVGLNGASAIEFNSLVPGQQYHFCVRHRNHLDVLSNYPVVAAQSMYYDFSNAGYQTFGESQTKLTNDGRYVLHSGEMNQDHVIQITDFDQWSAAPSQLNVYSPLDVSMDGDVQNTDRDLWYINRSKLGTPEVDY